ncbi:ABC transporter substrate-binding protein [Streptococcus acidominimus]|uniref:ABC transporter substrate-binding protein n=1 Tax=Streptococcus acidominimus TaxID=1326 RepID=A0A4Y9FMS0_STRAI|nr:ABC transporter substrate-binding protein [Streptococcus acidominimus]MBF0819490.1 ABC transporter substrate-binding protein [Streptococcus acidominimus]MBF0838626.1 ABC transporter substrate-binding protein [Streptococcus acidominimus]MBF0846716.1 ABC transporter substrate-binding protein [Streptococcus danieliae]TFU29820.1 ABC transporter substrate-binding protein [Streptococcus acidominimus]
MKTNTFKVALVSFASAMLLAACGNVSSTNPSATGTEVGDTIKIGYNLELSGAVSSYGQTEKNGADLAVKEINAAGGVDGKKIEVIAKDNKSETAEAATIATSLASEGANIIIGPATSGASGASIASATSTGVPMISPSGTQTDLVVNSEGKVQDFFFRATFTDGYQGEIMADYATKNLSAKKVVLYYDNSSDYGKGVAESFQKAYKGEIVSTITFASGDKDFQAALTKLKGLDFDAIIMPGYYNETGTIVKQARGLGIDKPILGSDGFDSPLFAELATASAANKVYYLSAFVPSASERAKAFHEAYTKEYGEAPSMFSALAYDSVYMAAEAAKGSKNSTEVKDNLAALKDFDGVTGKMSIDKDHNVVKSVYVVSLKDGKADTVDTVSLTETAK